MQKKCESCECEYNAKRKIQKYCSKKCQYNSYKNEKIKRVKTKCLFCEDEFKTLPNKLKTGKSKYCSRKCKDTHQKELYLKDGNPVYGNKHSDEWKEMNSNRLKDLWSSETHKKKVKLGQEKFFEKNEFWCGNDNKLLIKKIETNLERYGVKCVLSLKENQELREKICLERYGKTSFELMREGLKNKKSTNIEIKIASLLLKNKIKFETQYDVYYNNDKYKVYDFYLNEFNLLIEADGDYWHSNPNKYKGEILTEVQKINIKNDKFKNELAKECGYNLIRFWETDIKKKGFKFKLFKEIKKYGK